MADEIKTIPTEETELSEAELAEFFADSEKVPFTVTRTLASGKVVKKTFFLDIDPNGVTGIHLARYRKVVAELAVKTEEIQAQAKQNVVADEPEAEPEAESAGADETGENEEVLVSEGTNVRLLSELTDVNDQYADAEAQLLVNLVLGCDYPGKDFRDPKVLCQRVGAGPAAREALHGYFFGSSDEPEAENGTNPTPITEKPSATSEATDSAEDSPPIS